MTEVEVEESRRLMLMMQDDDDDSPGWGDVAADDEAATDTITDTKRRMMPAAGSLLSRRPRQLRGAANAASEGGAVGGDLDIMTIDKFSGIFLFWVHALAYMHACMHACMQDARMHTHAHTPMHMHLPPLGTGCRRRVGASGKAAHQGLRANDGVSPQRAAERVRRRGVGCESRLQESCQDAQPRVG